MVDERKRQRMGQEVKDKRTNKDQTVTPFKQSSKLVFFYKTQDSCGERDEQREAKRDEAN